MPDNKSGGETPFLTDVKTLRERARQHIQAGAVTSNYGADPKVVCKVLNEALATEIVCVLRYKRHYFMHRRACTRGRNRPQRPPPSRGGSGTNGCHGC